MAAHAKHRDAIVMAAAVLFRRQGYAATGLAEILAASGAPKGSLYHYFPDGKRQVGLAAISLGGAAVTSALEALAGEAKGPGDLVRRYAAAIARDFERSGWSAGCPIATILLEVAPSDAAMAQAADGALRDWAAVIERSAIAAGAGGSRVERLATLAIATIEGGLIQARAAHTGRPLTEACEVVADLLDDATASAAG